jgi:hypothetical protein
METGVCIYCGRTLALPALLEKGGKFRCKDEDDCLDYQTRVNSPDSPEEPEDMAGLIKTFLSEAAQRIAACRTDGEPAGEAGGTAEEEAVRTWMASALAALAAEYREKADFQFHAGENGAYDISYRAADRAGSFTVGLAPLARSRYALTVAAADAAAAGETLYREFIYKSYPGSRREEALRDLSVLLLVLAGEGDRRSALLRQFRMEFEARCYAGGDL